MKLWSKTLIASAVCLFLAGCDDSSKVDANNLANDAANKTKEIKESIAPAKTAEEAADSSQPSSH